MVPPQEGVQDGSFNTTPWSLLFAFRYGSNPTGKQTALSRLCEIYWRPIFIVVRRCGYDLYDAQDLTQNFMVYLIQREAFASADRAKGKFRSYVLGTLKHFLIHAWRDGRTQKRGGGADTLPLDEAVTSEIETAERSHRHVAQPHSIDRQWALAIQHRVDDRIATEHAAAQKSELYLTLRRHLTAEKSSGSYKEDARRLRRPVATVRSDVARMRRRYTELLLEELKSDAPEADLKQELLDYCRIIACSGGL
jgi:DNA-directed RNA polymerase specialized sigma24 family protein